MCVECIFSMHGAAELVDLGFSFRNLNVSSGNLWLFDWAFEGRILSSLKFGQLAF